MKKKKTEIRTARRDSKMIQNNRENERIVCDMKSFNIIIYCCVSLL